MNCVRVVVEMSGHLSDGAAGREKELKRVRGWTFSRTTGRRESRGRPRGGSWKTRVKRG